MAASGSTSLFSRRQRRSFFLPQQLPFNVTVNINPTSSVAQVRLTASSCHAILAFAVPVLLNFIEVNYVGKGNSSSPFETHPTTMIVAVASLLVYCLAYGVDLRLSSRLPPTYVHAFCSVMTLSGSLLLASLASILFPHWVRPVLYVIYALLSLGDHELRGLVRMLCQWIKQKYRHNTINIDTLPVYNVTGENFIAWEFETYSASFTSTNTTHLIIHSNRGIFYIGTPHLSGLSSEEGMSPPANYNEDLPV